MSLLALIILLFLSIVCIIALFLKNVLKVFFLSLFTPGASILYWDFSSANRRAS